MHHFVPCVRLLLCLAEVFGCCSVKFMKENGCLCSPVRPRCDKRTYYMASSVSGQDEPNRALWLATRAGEMEPSCPLGTTRCIPQAEFPLKQYNKSFIDQVCSVNMAGYWPRSFSMDRAFVSAHNHAKKNSLANIQPSWPHTWLIPQICSLCLSANKLLSTKFTTDKTINGL